MPLDRPTDHPGIAFAHEPFEIRTLGTHLPVSIAVRVGDLVEVTLTGTATDSRFLYAIEETTGTAYPITLRPPPSQVVSATGDAAAPVSRLIFTHAVFKSKVDGELRFCARFSPPDPVIPGLGVASVSVSGLAIIAKLCRHDDVDMYSDPSSAPSKIFPSGLPYDNPNWPSVSLMVRKGDAVEVTFHCSLNSHSELDYGLGDQSYRCVSRSPQTWTHYGNTSLNHWYPLCVTSIFDATDDGPAKFSMGVSAFRSGMAPYRMYCCGWTLIARRVAWGAGAEDEDRLPVACRTARYGHFGDRRAVVQIPVDKGDLIEVTCKGEDAPGFASDWTMRTTYTYEIAPSSDDELLHLEERGLLLAGEPAVADVVIPASQKITALEKHWYSMILTGVFRARASGVVSFTSKSSQALMGMVTNLLIAKRYATESSAVDPRRESGEAFTTSHPIAFSLYDDQGTYALYISDNPASQHVLHLELKNVSGKVVVLDALQDRSASEENRHFELRFPSGALSRQTLERLKTPDGRAEGILGADRSLWDLAIPDDPEKLRRIPIYLLYKGTEPAIEPGESRRLTLRNFTAAAAGGARPVKVQLRCGNLHYAGDQARTPIVGTRTQQLQIASHVGSREIPLHVGFVGPNQVANDGKTETRLLLQLMNVARPREAHSTPITFLEGEDTLILSFDLAEDDARARSMPWALGTFNDLVHLTKETLFVARLDESGDLAGGAEHPTPDDRWVVRCDDPRQRRPQWVLTPTQSMTLDPGRSLFISMSGLKSSLPSGSTNLYVQYQNIDGYWQGQFICPMEKSRLRYVDPGTVTISGDLNVVDGRSDTPLLMTSAASGGVDVKGDFRVFGHNAAPIVIAKGRTIRVAGELDLTTEGRVLLPGPQRCFIGVDRGRGYWAVRGAEKHAYFRIFGAYESAHNSGQIIYEGVELQTGEVHCQMDISRRVHLSGTILLAGDYSYNHLAQDHPSPHFSVSVSLPTRADQAVLLPAAYGVYSFDEHSRLVLMNYRPDDARSPLGTVHVMVENKLLTAFGSFISRDPRYVSEIHHEIWISVSGLSYQAHASS